MIPAVDDLRKHVQELRTAAGLTQEAAAEAAGVSQSFVAKLEAGNSVPNYRDAAKLYNTLEQAATTSGETAATVMTEEVVTLHPGDSVGAATGQMTADGFSQLPVVEDGDCVGSVTSRRLLDADPEDAVREHMGAAFPEVPRDTSLDAVTELLDTANAVLVRENESIEGIITAADVL